MQIDKEAQNRLFEQLQQQIRFLRDSCGLYDQGRHEEAIRIATCLRVLIHQTPRSTSLLAHLDMQDIRLVSTVSLERFSTPPFFFDGLCMSTNNSFLVPKLAAGGQRFSLTLEEWWNQVVMYIDGESLTRKEIVLTAANKDGGAHVDEVLPENYHRLSDGFFIAISQDGSVTNFRGHHLSCLRQIGYEFLTSPSTSLIDVS